MNQEPEQLTPEEAEAPAVPTPETEPVSQPEPQPAERPRRHRGLFFGLAALLVTAAAVVILLRALSFEAQWQNGRLVISFFGAQSPQIAEAVTESAAPAEEQTAPQLTRAATGTGVELPLEASSGETLSLQEVYRRASPSAVSIRAVQPGGQESSGSGVIMTADGYLLTNHHVIDGASSVTVQTAAGEEYDAALVGSDAFSDLAVLKIEAENLPAATFVASDSLQVGDAVAAIGDPLGIELRGTMTDGIISAINRDIVVEDRSMTLLQTNAALNAGNSGGPLVNSAGEVIGINTMKLSSAYVSVEGLGFAIPMDVAKPIVDGLIAQGYVAGRPALGITCTAVAAQTSAFYDIPAGIYIKSVESNSDAARQGLREGDIIVAIEGTEVSTLDALNTVKNRFRAGDSVSLTIWREGETFQTGVMLIDRAQ